MDRIGRIEDFIDNCGLIRSSDGLSARCPICGVISNSHPDYEIEESGTNVLHRLSYCGHLLEWIAQTSAEGIKFQEPTEICWNFCFGENNMSYSGFDNVFRIL